MTAVRKLAAIGAVIGVAPLLTTLLAGPADAHGAMAGPMSRTMGCGPEGGRYARSKACQAAMKVSGAQALRDWDNLRVSGVAGRDRQKIPDGRLCSGGLAAYKGLDLARADWPATRLTSGAPFTFTYRETIPHRGAFKLYITRNGYNPLRRLRWADLETRPFAVVTDPPIRDGSYIIKGRLPRGKSGRHLIYTIWQNSSTPDTYYSCSDVVFGGKAGGAAAARKSRTATAKKKPKATPATPAPSAGAGVPDGGGTELNAANKSAHSALPLAAGGTAVLLALAGGGAVLLTRRHRRSTR
ncbi:MAG TPA: lytic polysaccharide monooxygenase [Streptosporangiaceae bacterium]